LHSRARDPENVTDAPLAEARRLVAQGLELGPRAHALGDRPDVLAGWFDYARSSLSPGRVPRMAPPTLGPTAGIPRNSAGDPMSGPVACLARDIVARLQGDLRELALLLDFQLPAVEPAAE
jgi:hypothetical protein